MLQDIRDNAQGTIAKVIVGLIALTFALWGVDSIVGGFGGEPSVATVNGDDITQINFERAVDAKKRQILAQLGDNADPSQLDENKLRSSVLQGLIDQQILIQSAQSTGVFVSDDMVNQLIAAFPQFQIDGKFNNDIFLATIRNIGMTTKDYREAVKKEVLITQMRNAVVGSAFAVENEFDRLLNLDRQKRTFYQKTVDAKAFVEKVEVNEQDLKAFYDQNPSQFSVPEQVEARYLELSKKVIADSITVEQAELEAKYNKDKESYEAEEERKVSHILIELNGDRDIDAAQSRALEVIQKFNSGDEFEALAKTYSDDVGSAENGGELGFVGKGAFDGAFEDAMFALSVGEISKPVVTDFGVHVIRVTEIQKGEVPSFEEMRVAIELQVKSDKAEKRYVEAYEKLADITYSSSNLEEAAEQLGLDIKTQASIQREKGVGRLNHHKVLSALFSSDVLVDGNNSPVIDLDADTAVVVRVSKHEPEKQLSFEDVESGIRTLVVAEKAMQMAEQEADGIINAFNDGDALTRVRSDSSWELVSESARANTEIAPDVVKSVFTLTESNPIKSVKSSPSTFTVVILDKIDASADGLATEERATLQSIINTSSGAVEYQTYENRIRSVAEIERI